VTWKKNAVIRSKPSPRRSSREPIKNTRDTLEEKVTKKSRSAYDLEEGLKVERRSEVPIGVLAWHAPKKGGIEKGLGEADLPTQEGGEGIEQRGKNSSGSYGSEGEGDVGGCGWGMSFAAERCRDRNNTLQTPAHRTPKNCLSKKTTEGKAVEEEDSLEKVQRREEVIAKLGVRSFA